MAGFRRAVPKDRAEAAEGRRAAQVCRIAEHGALGAGIIGPSLVESKPAFREAFQRRRCLVPVYNFYELKTTATGKQPYAIALADRRLMAAGKLFMLDQRIGGVGARNRWFADLYGSFSVKWFFGL
jgi:hypothetical protein